MVERPRGQGLLTLAGQTGGSSPLGDQRDVADVVMPEHPEQEAFHTHSETGGGIGISCFICTYQT